MGTPFKMKGSPMARNYGAPFKQETVYRSVSTERQGTEKEDKHWSPRTYNNAEISVSKMSNEFASETDSLPHNYTSHSYTVDKGNQHNKSSHARAKKYENNMIAVKPKATPKPNNSKIVKFKNKAVKIIKNLFGN